MLERILLSIGALIGLYLILANGKNANTLLNTLGSVGTGLVGQLQGINTTNGTNTNTG